MKIDTECTKNAVSQKASVRMNTQRTGQLAITLLLMSATVLPMLAANAQSNAGYADDTHGVLNSGINVKTVSGPFGYDSYKFTESADGRQLALCFLNCCIG